MQIDIQARQFPLTDSLRNHAEQRLYFALTRHEDHIQRIVMRLSDINGPRGGEDKCCDLLVVLSGLPDVMIHAIETDLYVSIDRAAERARRTLVRKIERRRSLLRQNRTPVLSTPLLN